MTRRNPIPVGWASNIIGIRKSFEICIHRDGSEKPYRVTTYVLTGTKDGAKRSHENHRRFETLKQIYEHYAAQKGGVDRAMRDALSQAGLKFHPPCRYARWPIYMLKEETPNDYQG